MTNDTAPRAAASAPALPTPDGAAPPARTRPQPTIAPTPHDRRRTDGRPLRAALDGLAATIRARRAGAEVRAWIDAVAAQARRRGIPPERYLVSLKRALDAGTDPSRRDAPVVGARGLWTPYQRLVTLAIRAYYRADAGRREHDAA